jgi:hypothetical protein
VITVKLIAAILTFIVSGGHVVFATFRHHETVNPQHGAFKFIMLVISLLSLVYLVKDMSDDVDVTLVSENSSQQITATAEINYWHEIDHNPSPENYCAYIEKYPLGQFVDIARHRLPVDCLQLAQQAQEAQTAAQQAQTRALVEAQLAVEVNALTDTKRKLEREAKAVAELKEKMAAEAQAAAELKQKMAAEAKTLAVAKLQLAAEAKMRRAQFLKAQTIVKAQLRPKKPPSLIAKPSTIPHLDLKIPPEVVSKTPPKAVEVPAVVIEEELQQEHLQEREFKESVQPFPEP